MENCSSSSANEGDFKFEFVSTNHIVKTEVAHEDTLDHQESHGDQSIRQSSKVSTSGRKLEEAIVKKSYSCGVCKRKFLQRTSLQHHLVTHFLPKAHRCNICGAAFSRNYLLLRHINTHSEFVSYEGCVEIKSEIVSTKVGDTSASSDISEPGLGFACGTCKKIFATRRHLKYHEKLHSVRKLVQCQFCSKTFKVQCLQQHIARVHSIEKPYGCPVCSKAFTWKSFLKKHLRGVHRKEKLYQCQDCPKAFTVNELLIAHMQVDDETHRNVSTFEGPRRNSCNVCGRQCRSRSYFLEHVRIHTGDKPYKCDICDSRFRRRTRWREHVKIHFLGDSKRPYKCKTCHKVFSSDYVLNKHSVVHTLEKRYECEVCGKRFLRLQGLDNHMIVHSSEKAYKCYFCDNFFKSFEIRRTHVKKIHINFVQHKCNWCDRSYSTRRNLDLHIQKEHIGLKCDVCHELFHSKMSLDEHRRVHLVEPNKCSECGMSFLTEFGLELHMRTHTVEKQQKCLACRTFRMPGMKQRSCLKCAKLSDKSLCVPTPEAAPSLSVCTVEMKSDVVKIEGN